MHGRRLVSAFARLLVAVLLLAGCESATDVGDTPDGLTCGACPDVSTHGTDGVDISGASDAPVCSDACPVCPDVSTNVVDPTDTRPPEGDAAAELPGCWIGGEYVPPSWLDPANPCQICDPERSREAWSENDGAPCDDGLFCNGAEICDDATGACGHAGNPCTGEDECLEDEDQCCLPDVPLGRPECDEEGNAVAYDSCGHTVLVEDCADTWGTCDEGRCGCIAERAGEGSARCRPGFAGADCEPCFVYVDGSLDDYAEHDGSAWSEAFETVQQGIERASERGGCAVWVKGAEGGQRYEESITLRDGVAVYGGFEGDEASLEERGASEAVAILDAGGSGTVATHAGGPDEENLAILDGLVLTGGAESGLRFVDASTLVRNCHIVENQAATGGGAYIAGGAPRIEGCTFYDNGASAGGAKGAGAPDEDVGVDRNGKAGRGGAVSNEATASSLSNSILWENKEPGEGPSAQVHDAGGELAVRHSDVQWGHPGQGNIEIYPWFVDVTSGDLRLYRLSPCVDAGDSLAALAGRDLHGRHRVQGAAVDMGAYESEGNRVYPASCKEALDTASRLRNGSFEIFIDGDPDKPWWAYCHDTGDTPAEYLALERTGDDLNFATYKAGGYDPGTDVRTVFRFLRLDPVTLVVDRGDTTFATSTGRLDSGKDSQTYATAGSCLAENDSSGRANIDLRGTPFKVPAEAFETRGWKMAGGATYSENDQVVDLTGGGACGYTHPKDGELRLLYVGMRRW